MNEKLLVVADLGRLKAYRFDEDRHASHPSLKLVEDWETGLTQHLSAEVTDQAGQYRKGPRALSDGEEHNLDLERRKRAARSLAQHISELLERERVDGCYLAADSRIHQHVLDDMEARDRAKVQRNVTANLSKLSPEEALRRFQ